MNNNLNSSESIQKSNKEINMEFTYANTSVFVYNIGNYGIAPWGFADFPDKSAQWIWYSPMSNFNALENQIPITIQYVYINPTKNKINGILNIIIDNSCSVFLNNKQLAENIVNGWNGDWKKVNFIIEPGSNLFEFKVKNDGGPGGLLVSAFTSTSTPNLLFHTDSTWKFIPIPINKITISTLSQAGLVAVIDKYFPWGCLTLNASPSQYVNMGNIITGMNGLSFGCWFKSNNNSDLTRIFDFANGPESDNIVLGITNGMINANIYITNISGDQTNLTTNINNNEWNHIVWIITKPIANISNWIIYLNGQMVWNKTGNYPINIQRNNCYIGKSNWNSDPNFNGSIANFVMYQKELSNLEVNALYNSLINSNDPDLYLYFPFSINSILDILVNNYAGKQFNLPIIESTVKSENWNCLQEGDKWIPVKMSNGNILCMSMDGKNCFANTENICKTKITNPITPENPVICSENTINKEQNNWCTNAKKIFSSNPQIEKINNEYGLSVTEAKPKTKSLSALDTQMESESINLKPIVGGGKVLSIKNSIDINNLLIEGIFKLRVNLPMMPPYIKGKNFNIQTGTGTEPNYFYLSIEKLDNNCSIKSINGTCIDVYADDKKCSSKPLTSHNQNNSYRLVLISSQYVLDPSIPLGKNSDFTLIQINGQIYLKNIQTGYLPSLYLNDSNILIYGDMEINSNTNINKVDNLITNTICGQETPVITDKTSGTKNIKCNIQQDPGLYLITTKNIGESSPVRININDDKTISLNILSFNRYGFPTNVYSLIYCNFNVKTYSYIEKITNTLGTFLVNMVCFSDVKNNKLNKSNQLKFTVELLNFPPNFIKENSVFTI